MKSRACPARARVCRCVLAAGTNIRRPPSPHPSLSYEIYYIARAYRAPIVCVPRCNLSVIKRTSAYAPAERAYNSLADYFRGGPLPHLPSPSLRYTGSRRLNRPSDRYSVIRENNPRPWGFFDTLDDEIGEERERVDFEKANNNVMYNYELR